MRAACLRDDHLLRLAGHSSLTLFCQFMLSFHGIFHLTVFTISHLESHLPLQLLSRSPGRNWASDVA